MVGRKMDKGTKVRLFTRGFFALCLFVLSGCINEDEGAPQIVSDRSSNRPVLAPTPTLPKIVRNTDRDVPDGWVPPSGVEKSWRAIIIHHSATESGSAAVFDKSHKEVNDWDGVGYDFVIGNGTDSGDGQVEVTFRWRQQRTGAHCKTPKNWANEEAVGICLVGNFNNAVPTPRQMWSLVKLVQFLKDRYRIPSSRIYGHRSTPGARVTDCPGRNFSMAKFKSMLNY